MDSLEDLESLAMEHTWQTGWLWIWSGSESFWAEGVAFRKALRLGETWHNWESERQLLWLEDSEGREAVASAWKPLCGSWNQLVVPTSGCCCLIITMVHIITTCHFGGSYCVRPSGRYFPYIILYELPSNPRRLALFSPFHQWRYWGSQNPMTCPGHTVSKWRKGIRNQHHLNAQPQSLYWMHCFLPRSSLPPRLQHSAKCKFLFPQLVITMITVLLSRCQV